MERIRLVSNLSEKKEWKNCQVGDTGIMLRINKALSISKPKNFFLTDEYFKYVIELKINNEYWIVFRRYSEILKEHERMCKLRPTLQLEPFPPKSIFNKSDTFQFERQKKLEIYLKNYIQIVLGENMHNFSDKSLRLTKNIFCKLFIFFNETLEDKHYCRKFNFKPKGIIEFVFSVRFLWTFLATMILIALYLNYQILQQVFNNHDVIPKNLRVLGND